MNLSEIGTVFGICVTLIGGTATGGKYYFEHEMKDQLEHYVPVNALLKRDYRALKKEAGLLEFYSQKRQLTDEELWQLQQLYQEIELLEKELDE